MKMWLVRSLTIPLVEAMTEWFTKKDEHAELNAAVSSLERRVAAIEEYHRTAKAHTAATHTR